MEIRKAVLSDITDIFLIIESYAKEGILLQRTPGEIESALSTFYVAIDHNSIIGVTSFHDYGARLKEIRSLAVLRDRKKKGVGSILVRALLQDLLREFPTAKVFVLTYTPAFFKKIGFLEVDKETLPEKIWKDCQNCVNKDNCGESALVYRYHTVLDNHGPEA